MGRLLSGALLPLLLLTAAGLNWSLMSLMNLLAFLFILFTAPKTGSHTQRWTSVSLCILVYSSLAMISYVIFYVISVVEGGMSTTLDSQWAKLIGFTSSHSSSFPCVRYFLAVQLSVAFVAFIKFRGTRANMAPWNVIGFEQAFSSAEYIGSRFRVVCCLLLPAVQLLVGISHPTWTSFPFFISSCAGLVDWSLTSNFLGLFRWWRYLMLYSSLNIVLLYVYQLPIEFSEISKWLAEFIGLYKISAKSGWLEICSSVSLLLYYVMLSCVKSDLEEMDFIMSTRENSLTEQLLPSKHSFFIRESRSGIRHTNFLLRGAVFRNFSINFFIYGFPISLLALSFWSFHFASLCAFGLLAYVGYILYAFPSMFNLHRLNGLLLVFILLWAASTYIFNVAFTVLNKKLRQDTEIWETIGLWHYPIPGFYLLAQFFLGILVTMGNLVNNSVFLYLSDGDLQATHDECKIEEREEGKVLIVATVAWGLRKSSRAIVLALILPLAMKPGFIHAVYMIYFMIYLLSHTITRRLRQSLILLCEAHVALLYILQLNLVARILEKEGSLASEILSELGLLNEANSGDFIKIVVLVCFCSVHSHGFDILYSFSGVVQHAPHPPVGFSILKAGLNKSVLLSVYTSKSRDCQPANSSHERKIASYLGTVGQKCLSAYRSWGTCIAFLTVFLAVYLVTPNYTSFGYLFFLLLWICGRQLVERTKRRLWFPLKLYAVAVFIVIYCLSVFITLQTWLSGVVDVFSAFGYNAKVSVLENVWESLAVLVVMQLYSYERRQSKYINICNQPASSPGHFAFGKRLLILHSEKILFTALLYASLWPISAFGFMYLLGMVICSTLPKTSRIPSKMFLVYSGILLLADYLFQMWGQHAEMFPNQKYSYLPRFLGLKVFEPGFFGIESGLRGKVVVIIACVLRYNVFYWLSNMPDELRNAGKWEEPCALFGSDDPINGISNLESQTPPDSNPVFEKDKEVVRNLWPFFIFGKSQVPDTVSSDTGDKERSNTQEYVYRYIWGSPKESQKWNKKRILSMRKERFELQKATLRIYLKFWLENLFNLFGLEINMIALLLASFAVLNAVSLLYIASLAACVLLHRQVIHKVWPLFVFSFASVLILEYLAIWKNIVPWDHLAPIDEPVSCHDCWRSSDLYFDHCKRCWLGITVDDPRMLISYYMVFIFASFKLRADHLSGLSCSSSYRHMLSQCKNASVLSDLSFETKGMWTFLDYLRLYSYCHLLDLVLALILVTGTLEYDILHLGYLGFALVFFRMRLEILKKRNRIFKYLRMYNFALIIFSLAYQSPFVGDLNKGKCDTMDYVFDITGFHKYDYGFRITSRSALVEIIIFMLVALQSYMFTSQEFDYVYKYLEAEQIGTIVSEQEKKAAWKTQQLQHIRETEEHKRMRNVQVEKMKSEMLNLQIQLHSMSATSPRFESSSTTHTPVISSYRMNNISDKEETVLKQDKISGCVTPSNVYEFPNLMRSRSPTTVERHSNTELLDRGQKDEGKSQVKENPLISAVHLIEDGVSQFQSLGNLAVNNIVSFLNIENEETDSDEHSSEDEIYGEIETQNTGAETLEQTFSMQSVSDKTMPDAACLQICMIFRYIWAQMRSNNDVVCYCCFVLVYLWNFSLLSMVYLAALFLYALCVNTGPSFMFWTIMLIYTEVCILLQYVYQIIIQHCGFSIQVSYLYELGFPRNKIVSSFVISNWPLFLVYLFTLLQSSITARDGEWASVTEVSFFRSRNKIQGVKRSSLSFWEKIQNLLLPIERRLRIFSREVYRYWKSLTQGAETPPYFVQLSMEVKLWPEDGIQPDRIESGINKLLDIIHDRNCKANDPNYIRSASRVRVQSIERSPESPSVALAVFEVVYVSPSIHSTSEECYKSLTPAADVANEILIAQHAGLFRHIGFPYPILSVIGGGKREIDLYAYTFCADLVVFFLVAIFYQSVIKNNSEFLEVYQLEDQFPKEFVFTLMMIFFLIVLDRIIYLCSFATGKVIFYLFSHVLFTYSVTRYAWYMEPSHQHAGRFALRAIYFTKAISLALQAIQIRHGIPHKSTLYRQFLTTSISQINFLGFRIYRSLPFLYELRCVLDWSCTTTSLTMYDWLKLEDIHASLFLVKCDANLNRAQHQQGQKQTRRTKFCNGICLFFVLICVIWAPMLMYSSGNPTNIANPIKDASVRIDLKTVSGSLTLFETTLCKKLSWHELNARVNLDPRGYLSAYNEQDIQLICCQSDASTLWQIPFVVQERFVETLDRSMDIIFSWRFTRDRPKGKEIVKYELKVLDEYLPEPSDVMKVLNGLNNSFRIYNIYPRYFRVTGSGDVRFLEQEVNMVSGDLVLNQGSPEWWSFYDHDASDESGCGEFGGPMAIVLSEETPQGILGETLSKFSIWGLYITFVLAVGRFIRLQCSDLRMRIPYENLPACDRLLAICEDIYAARAEGELEVEEVLYWTLVKIYRSPHMLLEYTKTD